MKVPSITGMKRKVPKKPSSFMLLLIVPRMDASTDRRQVNGSGVEEQLE